MTTARRPSRRILLGAAALLPVGAALAACTDSGSDAPAAPGGSESAASGADFDAIIAAGPVAADADIAASAWAQKVKDAGKLTRGGTIVNQVFSLQDPSTGKVTGFDGGLTQLLAQYILGKDSTDKIDYIDTTVDTRETMLVNGTVDTVIATYSITAPRLEKIDFAGPYYLSGTSIQVRTEDKDSITDVADLTGKKLVTQSNSTGITAIEENVKDPASVQQLPDNESCVTGLKQGRFDAYVLDQGVLLGNSKADPTVTVVGKPFTEDPYGIGLPKDSGALDFVNAFLTAIEEDGTWKKLYDATIGTVIEGAAPTPPTPGDLPTA
ncbi:glutamate ABC transporter substrate-binding protein [Brachybacterium sp. AOP25-B2-12]|uniref:glutamate ABC transporter substrate-binding protein n=1 Tax=Brachybacterium sp. AOP25-B2-12 TaxID=3457710 RepID=UPI004034850B